MTVEKNVTKTRRKILFTVVCQWSEKNPFRHNWVDCSLSPLPPSYNAVKSKQLNSQFVTYSKENSTLLGGGGGGVEEGAVT